MEAADILCDSLFCWLENRKECADTLLELAQELENVHERSNITQGVGDATTVLSISGALLATILTGGLASPLLAAATAGTLVSFTSSLVEAGMSSSTFNKATELMKEDEKVGRSIQKQLRDLKVRCGETLKDRCGETLKDRCGETLKDRCGGAPLGTHADELDCEVVTRLMWALARRSNIPVPLDFLRGFNRATFFRHLIPGGLDPAEASDFICQALGLDRSPEITSSLKVLAKEMVKNIELIAIKVSNEAGSNVSTFFLQASHYKGLGISLYDLIGECEEMVKSDRVPEARQFLRDSSRQIVDGQQELKEQLDAINEIIEKLFRMKRIFKELGGYSLCMTQNVQNIMAYIIGTCTDDRVVSWLQGLAHPIEFVNLLRFLERLTFPEDLTKPDGDHIHIVFVGHGRIDDRFMPAGGLVPAPNITDTVLYSPWNCRIDANAAFAIAQGSIRVTNRQFYNERSTAYCQPIPSRDRWNSMRASLHDVPEILLAPVTPEEEAWAFFHQLWQNRAMEIENHVILPYVVPQHQVNAFGEIPLYILVFATSFILMLYNKTATVHLAACLSRRSGSPSRPVEWRTQYAYTSDGTWMSVDTYNVDSELYRAFRSLFDTNP